MNDHVAKPIEPEDLWKALLKWIKPKHAKAATAAVKPQTATSADLTSTIAGLDMSNGLRRVLGKKPLYLSMLRKFVAGQKSAPAEILKALEANDWDTAERLAHTLKGVSGNIGATDLQRLAENLETAIREQQPRNELDDLLSALKHLLKNLIAQLEQKLPLEQVKISIPVDAAELKAVCDNLITLLTNDDAEAAEVLEANAKLLNAAFPGHYQKIEADILSFNFEAALAALSDANGTPTKG
jgi:two-component system sensor histidine kinase/response regulator